MSSNNTAMSASESGHPSKFVYETEFKLYEVEAQSAEGRTFQNLSAGPEKIKFLVENGTVTTKETGGRIMRPEKGAWRFYNVGQLEYMFLVDDGTKSETELEGRYKGLGQSEEKKAFFYQNATKIREWPERIQRTNSV